LCFESQAVAFFKPEAGEILCFLQKLIQYGFLWKRTNSVREPLGLHSKLLFQSACIEQRQCHQRQLAMNFLCSYRIILRVCIEPDIWFIIFIAPDFPPFVESLGHVSKLKPMRWTMLDGSGSTYVSLELNSSHC
jgi:hypothetical protein